MPRHPERTALEWFQLAERAHGEGHQACASCGRRHQVYKGRRGPRMEYYCPACDFYAFHDESKGQFFAAAGHEAPPAAHPELASMSHTTTV